MNSFPTLYKLSLDVVVNFFSTGFLPTNHVTISTNVQENICKGAIIARGCYDDHTKALIKMFQPTKLHLNFDSITNGTFNEIRKLKLTELKIENFELISRYTVSKRRPVMKYLSAFLPSHSYFRISCFLGEILSRETKKSLRVLDLSGDKSFGRNWMEAISFMFLNLEVLIISNRTMSETDFKSLCTNLPNLRFLDVSNTGITNLNGISKLKNLRYLHIGSLEFQTEEDVEDLFELKKLTHLVFGDNLDYETDYHWLFEKPLPELTTLICEWQFADDEFLRKIMPKLPKLQTIEAIATLLTQDAAPSGVSLHTTETMECMMETAGYFRSQGNWNGVIEIFELFNQVWDPLENGIICTPELMTIMVNELEAVIRRFKLIKQKLPIAVEEFLQSLPFFFDGGDNHLDVNKLKVIDMLSMNLKNHLKRGTPPTDGVFKLLWIGIKSLVSTTENVNIDRICSLAMEFIIHGGGFHDWEPICAEILELFNDRLDFSLAYYENVDFQKLHECFITI